MTFCTSLLSRLVAGNEVLRYMVRGLDCVIACVVLVPADYKPNIPASANIFNDFIYGIFRCDDALSGFFGSGGI